MKLHLGCSDDFKSNWLNVDCTAPPAGSIMVAETTHYQVPHWKTPAGFLYQAVDLNQPWPWEDNTVDEIVANDVFEHLGSSHWGYAPFELYEKGERGLPATRLLLREPALTTMRRVCIDVPGKIWAMNEAHRVLKPDGILNFTVPSACLSDGRMNVGAFADPTHRSYWTFDDCFYFGEQWNTPDMERGRLGEAYGITALFQFPLMTDCGRLGWKVNEVQPEYSRCKGLAWKLEEANGRAKLRARIEAAK